MPAQRGVRNDGTIFIGGSLRPSGSEDEPPVGLTLDIIPAVLGLIKDPAVGIQFAFNRPASGFRDGDIHVIFQDDTGELDEGRIGYLTSIGTNDNQRVYACTLNVPDDKAGEVVITVAKDAAAVAVDPTITGPSGPRYLRVPYNRLKSYTAPTVAISTPTAGVFIGKDYNIQFIWSLPVSDFVDTDVELSTGASISGISGYDGEGRAYEGKLTLPANTTGTVSITVKANSVKWSGGTAPAQDTTVSFAFNSQANPKNRTVTGGTRISTNTKTIASNTGVYNGVFDPVCDATYLYKVEQLMHVIDSSPNKFTNEQVQAGAQLVRITRSNGARTVIKSWDEITAAARSLFIKNGTLYWFEGSGYAEMFNDDVDTVIVANEDGDKAPQKQYTWKNGMGKLYRYVGGQPQEVGDVARSAFLNPDTEEAGRDKRYGVHIGAMSPMVELPGLGNPLSVVAGYGDLRKITDIDDAVSDIGNWTETVYGQYLNGRIDFVNPNGMSGWELCEAVAKTLNAKIAVQGDRVDMFPGTAPQAKLNAALSAAATTTTVKDVNRLGITQRIALIGDEIVGFTPSSLTLGSLLRGQMGTTAVAHTADTPVYFIDYAIELDADTLECPIDSVNFKNDLNLTYNVIEILYADGTVASVKTNTLPSQKKTLQVPTLLSPHQKADADALAEDSLLRFGKLRLSANLTIKFSPFLKPSDYLYISIPGERGFARVCEIMGMTHRIEERQTDLILATI